MNLSKRSYSKELLDNDDIPFDDIRQNMKELNVINTWLGGHAITLAGLKRLLGARKTVTICEIGCGGGDNLHAISKYCRQNKIAVNCIGIDIKRDCIEYAKEQWRHPVTVTWIASDYQAVEFERKPDIIFSSLFCHHFTEAQLAKQLQWMKANSTIGFFVNDLQRHVLAYHAIKILTRLFSSSYLVKNDAPLSVARGFTKNEWQQVVKSAETGPCQVQWKWAFRYLLIYRHG
ncbi:methyltransferase domain-containing protein [Foetidibacter luteolus]|uniref:methyltransferase domain-containing protein n=1 Tax=Foetidibacter luteolus TaxID=2608880 RepID=UPI00129A481A|nr:methyltransferase domain-containing protein [Foetidibacter luteolus]